MTEFVDLNTTECYDDFFTEDMKDDGKDWTFQRIYWQVIITSILNTIRSFKVFNGNFGIPGPFLWPSSILLKEAL